jgi:hypothetical protein
VNLRTAVRKFLHSIPGFENASIIPSRRSECRPKHKPTGRSVFPKCRAQQAKSRFNFYKLSLDKAHRQP